MPNLYNSNDPKDTRKVYIILALFIVIAVKPKEQRITGVSLRKNYKGDSHYMPGVAFDAKHLEGLNKRDEDIAKKLKKLVSQLNK